MSPSRIPCHPDRARAVRCASAAAAVLVAAVSSFGQGMPDDLIVIKAARVITVSGEEFSPGIIVIEDGKITGVGSGIEYPPAARVIKAMSETVMPGFVHPRSRHELPAYRRSGINGNWNVSSEVYLDRIVFDDLLEAGYTSVCFVPDGTGIPGLASAYRTAGPDDRRALLSPAYLRANPEWNEGGKAGLRDAFKKAQDEIEKVKKAREEWEKKQKEKADQKKKEQGQEGEKEGEKPAPPAAVGGQALPPEPPAEEKKEEEFKPPVIDPKYQPLVDLIQEKQGARLMVEIFKASDLHHLDDVMRQHEDITPFYYLGTSRTTDYHNVVDELGQRKAAVILFPWIHYLPETTFRYNLIRELVAAGCLVSVSPAWESDREGYLSIRERLADLVRAGLSRGDAIKMLTQHPADAIGIGKQVATIEKDKDADLIFLGGDPLDPHAKVTRVMILGEIVWDAKKKGSSRS